MPRSCARPGCTAPATATFTFDGLRRIVWLGPLAEAAAYSAGDLCRRHAERLTPPRQWELRDVRPAPGSLAPTGTPAPSRYAPPAPVPTTITHSAPHDDRQASRPAARTGTQPLLVPTADRDPRPIGPPATSPLLSRAFRNAG